MTNIIDFPAPSAPCDTETDDRLNAMAAAMAGDRVEESRLERVSRQQKEAKLAALDHAINEYTESAGLTSTLAQLQIRCERTRETIRRRENR